MKSQSIIKAFGHAFDGILAFFRNDRNGRLHLAASVVVLAGASYFRISVTEWALLCLCIGLVVTLEMINHALERVCDLVHKEQHPVIKTIKDVSAGAVLVAALASVVVGLIIFIPRIQSIL